MLTDHDALFRAVCAHDEEDTPRLALADWFDENDRPDHAEFVRLQVEFAGLLDDGSDSQAVYDFLAARDYVTRPAAKWELIDAGIARRIVIANRLKELWNTHHAAWLADLPTDCGVRWSGFARGFPAAVEVTKFDQLVDAALKVRAAAPPVELICRELTPESVQRLAGAGMLSWVRRLTVQGESADALRELGKHPATLGIRELTVHGSDGAEGARLAEALAGSPNWGGLRSFHTAGVWFASVPAQVLFQAAHLRGLTTLRVTGNDWTAQTVRAFVETGFPNLRDLRFCHSDLGDDAAEVLANAPSLARVAYFDLAQNKVGGAGATALLCSPHLSSMAFIGLESNPVRGLDRAALRKAPAGGLRLLHCHGCRLSVPDVGALVRSPRLRDLWYLDLDDNNLATGAVREIVRGLKGNCPPVVWLTMNRIGDEGAIELANWPAAARLRVLELYRNPITEEGVKALLGSPHLKNLDGLGVPRVPAAGIAKSLARRFKDHGRME